MTTTIDVINRSQALTDQQAQVPLKALGDQIYQDFSPLWDLYADLLFVDSKSDPDPTHWWMVLLDDSDTAGALGYHDITPAGLPLGKVFVKTDLDNNLSWTVTLSHELLEMLADPEINLMAQMDSRTAFAYEVCDAVEDDSLGYLGTDGETLLSDFVTPYWFMPSMRGQNVPFSFKNNVTEPTELAPGGYISVLEFRRARWGQITEQTGPRQEPRPGSRRERRVRGKDNWQRSTT